MKLFVIPKLLLFGFFLSSCFLCNEKNFGSTTISKPRLFGVKLFLPRICWLQRPQSWNFWGICRPYKGITLGLYSNTLLMGNILHISWCGHWVCRLPLYLQGLHRRSYEVKSSFNQTVANQRRCDFWDFWSSIEACFPTHGFVSNLDTPFIKLQP